MAQKKVKSKEALMAKLQDLCGTKVTMLKDKKTMECMTTNPETNKSIAFHVKQDGTNVSFKPTANIKLFPEQLRSKVEFEEDQLPFLMKDIYNSDMFKQDNE